MKPAKRKAGRPRIEFDQKTADRICEQIIDGKSLRRICTQKAMPTKKTVLRWLQDVPAFADQYAIATDARGDTYADYITELVDKANENNYNSTRVKIDALKWIASKLKPKKYGDRASLEIDAQVRVEEVADDDIARRWLFAIAQEARNASLEKFIETQVLILKLVAENIAKRGGGSLDPRLYEGTFGELAKGLLDVAEVVRRRLSGESKALLPAPAANVQKPVEKDVTAGNAPDTAPTTRARDRYDGDDEVVI